MTRHARPPTIPSKLTPFGETVVASAGQNFRGHGESVTERDTTAVDDATQALEFEQFRNPEERHRLAAMWAEALAQRLDDVYDTMGPRRDRVGRDWIIVYDPKLGDDASWSEFYPTRTPQQEALAEGMRPFIDALAPKQREIVRLHYFGRLAEQQIAERLAVPLGTVKSRKRLALAKLRRDITEQVEPSGTLCEGHNGLSTYRTTDAA